MDINNLKKEFTFIDKQTDKDVYYCNCGHTFEKTDSTVNDNSLPEVKEENNSVLTQDDLEYLGLGSVYNEINLSTETEIICPSCNKNISLLSNQKKTFPINHFFTSQFNFIENKDELTIELEKVKVIINDNEELEVKSSIKYLNFYISSKQFFFKDYDWDKKIEFDLQDSIRFSSKMFHSNIDAIYDMDKLHSYIGSMAKHVSDVNNTDLVSSLLSETRGIVNIDDSLKIIAKISSIFIGIIKYSNLSTIAMTKGVNFLYDLMGECVIPSSLIMKKSNATSPLAIFNLLIKNYIAKVNDEVNEDNVQLHEYTFKSKTAISSDEKSAEVIQLDSEKSMQIKFKKIDNYTSKVKDGKGGYEVDKLAEDASASKFILKKITTFEEFKQILKYFKFYSKNEIIALMQKYDLKLLVNVIDLIYFRDKMELKELHRVLLIIEDFIEKNIEHAHRGNKYSLINEFSFTYYDDSVMMMEVLDFDPKREFNKIKKYDTLIEYHDNLVKYFSVVTDSEKNDKFLEFVDRFRFLEKQESGNPIEIVLIDSPAMLIQEGVKMRHSASSYSKKVINNIYLIGQVHYHKKDESITRFTIGFNFNKLKGIEFHQVKGPENKQGSNEFKTDLMEFLKLKDISYRPLKDLKLK